MRAALAVIAALVMGAGGAACSDSSSSNASCPADEPATCPSPMPSYGSDIAPLIEEYCANECHNPTGSASDQPLSTYADLFKRRADVLDQVYQCKMPLDPAPSPTVEERVLLLGWLVCGAPDN